MKTRPFRLPFVLLAPLLSVLVHAQSGATKQDLGLNNLAHAAGYETAPLGKLGAVTHHGKGPIDVVLIPGWGFGADAFEGWVKANEVLYRITVVTLPGFGGTKAPPMPAAETSYGEATWTRAAEESIARLMAEHRARKSVIVGHFLTGAQIAIRIAAAHPDLVSGVVILGAEPMRFPASRRDPSGKTLMTSEERVQSIDRYMAPQWFKTVTRETFDTNNYGPGQYSRDSARATRLWEMSTSVPLPVMIRYLCEFSAMDLTSDFERLSVPVRVLIPGFSPEILADPKQAYVKTLFFDSWENVRGNNPLIRIETVPDSRIFVTDDQPASVREAIENIARPATRPF